MSDSYIFSFRNIKMWKIKAIIECNLLKVSRSAYKCILLKNILFRYTSDKYSFLDITVYSQHLVINDNSLTLRLSTF